MRVSLWRTMLGVLLLATGAQAQQTDIENCLSTASNALTVEFGGKTYHLRDEACRELFKTDPERYSQLFDALLEAGNGAPPKPKIKPKQSASLVPS
jgi:YHS domain-containing protein